jgi:uncharacterized protein with HXXEE motif
MDSLTAALALHVAEESPGFAAWARRNTWPGYRDRDFLAINAAGLAMTAFASAAVRREPRLFGPWYAAVVSQQLLWNPVFHLGTTIAYREYSPGLVTALGLFPALWWRETRRGLRSGRLSRRRIAVASGVGGVLHVAAVRRQVYGRAPLSRASTPSAV